MDQSEIDARVAKIHACRHQLRHYFDANGNRCCYDCRAFVRPVTGAAILNAPVDDEQ